MITQEIVQEFLDYNPETGELIWKERNRKWFKTNRAFNSWNSKYAGKKAFGSLANTGYFQGSIFNRMYHAHRIIWFYMTGNFPKSQIDHINHNRTDNRWFNLREVSRQDNNKNLSKAVNNTSGYTGVWFDKTRKKWRVEIKVNSIPIHIGRFNLLEDAIVARKAAERKHEFHENHGKET